MNKTNVMIKNRALEYVKRREWDKAVAEYLKLAENEKHNPNVFNELGDLYLKIGNKQQAFTAFHTAVDEYSHVMLYNNAVAVCKKILRLNPSDRRVNGKLASLRAQQGFIKEATTYAVSFIDQVGGDPNISDDEVKDDLLGLVDVVADTPELVERIADCLIARQLKDDAGQVLARLADYYGDRGVADKLNAVRARMQELGLEPPEVPVADAAAQTSEPPAQPAAQTAKTRKSPPADTEANDPAEPSPRTVPGPEDPPPASTRGPKKAPPRQVPSTPYDYGTIDLGAPASAASNSHTATEEMPEQDVDDTAEHGASASEAEPRYDVSDSPDEDTGVEQFAEPAEDDEDTTADGVEPNLGKNQVWIPNEELPYTLRSGDGQGSGEVVNVEDIIGQFDAEVTADVDAGDHRSHYDLGMAYLEMDLLPEAIREFQFASNSSMYQVRCLEMIGLCFLKQNQPRLAIKQLEKGLGLVGDVDKESLGLQYNLGLAHEMLGDSEKAKICFEDVYVIDVTFRDVGEKVKKYAS